MPGLQPDHVEVQPEHARLPVVLLVRHGMVEGEPRGNDGAPVAALRAVRAAVVERLVDQPVPQAGDGARADRARAAVLADRRAGEAVARQGRRDDVEGVERIAAVVLGMGQRIDDVQELDDRARPAVGDDQRQRPRRALDLGARLADEMQALRADIDQVVRPAVDRLLAALPVVAVPPVVDQLGQEVGIGAGGPRAVVGDGCRRPPAAQALVEIDQRPLGNVDLEGLGSVVTRVAHGDRRSAEPATPANPP